MVIAAAVIVFISYARGDTVAAHEVSDRLVAAGCEVKADWNIPAGVDWRYWIEDAIYHADVVVVLASRNSIRSKEMRHEWRRAERANRKILPVWIESQTPDYVRRIQRAEMLRLTEVCQR